MYAKLSRDVYLRMIFGCLLALLLVLSFFQTGKTRDVSIILCFMTFAVITSRNFFLPFLGETVYPTGYLHDREVEHAKVSVEIPIPNDDMTPSHIIFWASNPGLEDRSPQETYGKYKNSGVKSIPKNASKITVKIHCPSSYIVKRFGREKQLKPHVHYRFAYDSGILGKIHTANVVCKS